MKSLDSKLTESPPIDPRLEQIIESAAKRLQDGQSLDLEQLAAEHPQFAEQLRELLPAMAMLVRLGDTRSQSSVATLQDGHGPAPPYERLGDFRLVREIGRGGMGVVYEAEQLSMGRRVALKVLPFAALLDEKALQRFRNEVRAAAALDHPNIVAVHSVGEQQGVHFYAMQLVRGRSLAEVIAQLRRKSIVRGQSSVAEADDVPATDNEQLDY